MFARFVCVLSCMMMIVSAASAAAIVRVDLSQSGDVERGWIDWNTDGNRLGNEDVSRRFLDEADFDDDFTIDFIKIDSRNRDEVDVSIPMHDLLDDAFKEGDPFDMVIKGLDAGIYTMTTYHHDPEEDVPNDDGTLNITVQDADGTRLVANHLQQSWGPRPSFIGVATFRFRSDGINNVVITFADNNDGIHNEAFLNGFELSISIARDQASNPDPEDRAVDVWEKTILSWTPGFYAPAINGHRIYLSDVFADVNEGATAALQGTTSLQEYAPAELAYDTTYYWRIDEANNVTGWYKGQVWSFTTEPLAYAIPVSAVTATASSSYDETMTAQKTADGSGLDADDLHSDDENDMWLSGADDPNPWIQYEFDSTYKLHQMWIWNFNQSFEDVVGFGLKDVSIQYSIDGINWTAVESVTELPGANGEDRAPHDIEIDMAGAVARYVRITASSNWGGWNRYGLSEVRFFYIPMAARNPLPEAGGDEVNPLPVLSWRPGRVATSHDVYFGTDEQAVMDAAEPVTTVTNPLFESSPLVLANTYYWRVDEINENESPAIWLGPVWSFTTADFIVVEDFEDYDVGNNEIWWAWKDGIGYASHPTEPPYPGNGTGSAVGNENSPSYTEEMIIHGGAQSMPLSYNNTAAPNYSETTRSFGAPQDWTMFGIKTLVLYFQGSEINVGGQLYVKVNDFKVPYGGDPADITTAEWSQFRIDLTLVETDLQNVTEISIGIEGGSSGIIYVDDIQLWP